MTTTNDQLYIQKVINGDANAFAYLVDNYKNMVFSLALKITRSKEEAEEISQDTFVKAFKSLSSYEADAKFSTWLYRIAYNTALDSIKKNKKHHYNFELNEVTLQQIKSVEGILEGIERKERAILIKSCLDKLPIEEKAIVWMFYFDELSLKEIVNITGISEANVKVKLHRARKKLLLIVQENLEPEMLENYGRK